MENNSAVLAAIITFNPKGDLTENAQAIASQVDRLLIVDNGSTDAARQLIRSTAEATGAEVLQNELNLGIAAALNQAASYAQKRGFTWIATFDQDSRPADEMLTILKHFCVERVGKSPTAIASPRHVDTLSGIAISNADNPARTFRVLRSAMTSGNLLNIDAWATVGGFEEQYFVDYVDHEFCLRLRKNGFFIFEVSEAKLSHQLGQMRSSKFGPFSIRASHHSSLRRYYMTRNRILTWAKYVFFDPIWVAKDFSQFITEAAKIMLVESGKRKKLVAMMLGSHDAFRKRLGECRFINADR